MTILEISRQIEYMYKQDTNPDASEWNMVFANFDDALEKCLDLNTLIKCVLEDNNWYIPFDYRMKIMEKAKNLGANSHEFLCDYYSYKCAYLDPGIEWAEASLKLDELNERHNLLSEND